MVATSEPESGLRFRPLLSLAIALLVVVVVLAASVAVGVVLDRSTRETLRRELLQADAVFAESWANRRSVLRSDARVVAEEPRLKAVTAAEDVGRETIVGVAQELHQAVGSDLFVLVDAAGHLIVDTASPDQVGHDLKSHDVVRDALRAGEASGVWTREKVIYQVQARRLEFGDTPFGVLVLGYALGDKVANSLERQVGARTIFELDRSPVIVSNARGGTSPEAAALASSLARMPTGGTHEIEIGSTRHFALAAGLPGYVGKRTLRYVLVRSLDDALAPSLRLRRVLIVIALVSVVLALIAAALLSRALSRPLEALAGLTREYARGELSARAVPEGPRETRALALSLNRMAQDLDETRRSLREKDRLERELEIAERIQTALLPRQNKVSSLELSARMAPAATVGGDYYDVHAVPGGAFIGIGDVAGHGLTAGLVMVMVQSGVASLVRALPDAAPSKIVRLLNGVVYSNVSDRLGEAEHVTFTLLRYYEDGRVVHAGAHEDLIVYRKAQKSVEVIRTPGMWLGTLAELGEQIVDSEFRLYDGDVLVLHTDGITEARNDANRMYGFDALVQRVQDLGEEPLDRIRDGIFDEVAKWGSHQDDDRTLVVLRHAAQATDWGPGR
jgi:sigma-B regulation protein RsbU (phosphoserine phosphatase)